MLQKLLALAVNAGDNARRGLDLGLAILHNRLQLLSLELKEEQLRFVQALVWSLLGLGLFFMGLVLAVLAVIFLAGEEHRLMALAVCAGVLLLAGLASALIAMARLKRQPAPFAQTIAEFGKDRQWLSDRDSGV
ncbi:putative membrane protein [Desulfocurvibacter africanus PCS]|uniref:Putative membrane protein n=1 Tax=Desulfocurvibacter africanus PCS TaxID=1262666 RepID=M5Q3W1_DESAF|nr:phage holin family protein [Desulfocurvibacter africanus]EMG39138.1 putative membrane protein [Desulfocurvibacter africanus PCS]